MMVYFCFEFNNIKKCFNFTLVIFYTLKLSIKFRLLLNCNVFLPKGTLGQEAAGGEDHDLRILLLEDSVLDARLIIRHVEDSGLHFKLHHVQTGEEFHTALYDFHPDLILCDMVIPGYDGFAALDETRNTDKEIPFIFISGFLDEGKVVDTIHKGATDFV